jgi:DNA-binding PadR family transcriptional regulator
MGELSVTDWAVLAVLAEGEAYGFQIAQLFSGELASIWRIQKPQIYRSLQRLSSRGLAEMIGEEAGRGPLRHRYRITDSGRAQLEAWLETPVELRQARFELRLKLLFLYRSGREVRPLLERQHERYREALAAFAKLPEQEGLPLLVALWRREMAQASLRFVEDLLSRSGR